MCRAVQHHEACGSQVKRFALQSYTNSYCRGRREKDNFVVKSNEISHILIRMHINLFLHQIFAVCKKLLLM